MGVIADQTGPLSFVGIANANVARMVIGDINAKGGLLGRHVELCLEDSATDDAVAAAKATKLVEQRSGRCDLRRHLQLHEAGHQGPGRREGQDALHLPGAVRGTGVRSAHLLHRPGAGAAGRSVHSLADATDRGEEVLPAVGRLHLAARDEQEGPRGRHGQRRGDRRRGVLPARSHGLPRDGRQDHVERRGGGVQHDRAARRRAVPRAAVRLRLRGAADTSSARTSTRTS